MYSLLNFLATANTDIVDGIRPSSAPYNETENATVRSLDLGRRSYTEEEKRLVSISCVSVVTHLTLEFQLEEVRIPFTCTENYTLSLTLLIIGD